MTSSLKKLVYSARLPVYRAIRDTSVLTSFFGIKTVTFQSKTVGPKFTRLFPGLTGSQLSNGSALAGAIQDELPVEGVADLIAFGNQMLKENLTSLDRQAGKTAILGLADDMPLGAGHLYYHLHEVPLSERVLKVLSRDSAFTLNPSKVAESIFLGFPGSSNVTGDELALHRVGFRRDGQGELEYFPLSGTGTVAVPKPLGGMDFELGYGNIVEICGASSVKDGKNVYWSWLNNTTQRHGLDGRVLFAPSLVPEEKVLRLYALGFGKHPSDFADMVNAPLGSMIFTTMLETYVSALENYVQKNSITTFDATALEGVSSSLRAGKVDSMASTLFLKHAALESMNIAFGTSFQWWRTIAGGDTVAAPESTTTTSSK